MTFFPLSLALFLFWCNKIIFISSEPTNPPVCPRKEFNVLLFESLSSHEVINWIPTGLLGRFSTKRHIHPLLRGGLRIASQDNTHWSLHPRCLVAIVLSLVVVGCVSSTIPVIPPDIFFYVYHLPKHNMMGSQFWTSQTFLSVIVSTWHLNPPVLVFFFIRL